MQSAYPVYVWRLPGCTPFIVEIRTSVTGDVLVKHKGVLAEEIPGEILEMLAKCGKRFVGALPDFHKSSTNKPAFWVVVEPVAK